MKKEYKRPIIEITCFKAGDEILSISVEEDLPVFPGGTIYNSDSIKINGSGFGW